ncbi:MAG TPA: PPE domain-containing protein [Jatrophihabitans sp.]|nr:PPE domain-containing protein [Jatrophihabitans sp.]
MADLLGIGGPSGTDGGSSNWAAWGHAEIRSMLDTSVDPGDIIDAADGWRDLSRHATDVVTGLTRDLDEIVSGGWHGTAANAAVAALGPVNQWSASVAEAAEHTTALMDASGSSAGQAKATVPVAKPHDWGQSLRSFALSGPAGAFIDAVAQDQAQAEAHTEAVQIMNNVYSAPINDHRVAVPTYPPLADPTLQPPEQPPNTAPAPGLGQVTDGVPRNDYAGSASNGSSAPPSSYAANPQPAVTELQGLISGAHTGSAHHSGGPVVPEPSAPRQSLGGQVAAAAAGVPITTPIAGGGHNTQVPRRAGGVAPAGGGRIAGGHGGGAGRAGVGTGSAAEAGPRRSSSAASAPEGRMGVGLGRGASGLAGGRAGPGDLMSPVGGGRGNGGEDSEHRRPSYLIEMDDIFTDGRKVAPPVSGEEPRERGE